MATISTATNEKVFSINKWGGLNEHPDGDTRLKLGEASTMVNWKITRDGNLKRRPGAEVIFGLCGTFTEKISDDIVKIMSFADGEEEIEVFDQVSTEQVPGKVTVVGRSGRLEHGVWVPTDVSVALGIMSQTGQSDLYTVSNGVLRNVSDIEGTKTTINGLKDLLAQLADGAWLYYFSNEATYAIRDGSIREENGKYILYGYLVSAVPEDGGTPVSGLWSGYVAGKRRLLAASDGKLWSLYDPDTGLFTLSNIPIDGDGELNTDNGVNFFPFGEKVYLQDGEEYWEYDGTTAKAVEGYVPIVWINIGPNKGSSPVFAGARYELVNRLTAKRKIWLSPDGSEDKTFLFPEDIDTDEDVTITNFGGAEEPVTYTLTSNSITFTCDLNESQNSIQVEYTAVADFRDQVTHNRFAELYAGQTDTMICIYGDGTNRFLYSGMGVEDGMPHADYFPDQHEGRVGDANTPITSMIRHGSTLIAYKTNETWSCSYTQITINDEQAVGNLMDAFYILPVNRDKGNIAPGQVRLVNNNPVTCSGTELYQWVNSSYYTSNLTRDERQAKRISDRIQRSIKELDFEKCVMWDDDDNQEFYIVDNGVALIWNYAVDVWYRYEGFDVVTMCNFLGEILIGTSDGKVIRLTDTMTTDVGKPIKAQWESGAIDFGASNIRKYSSMMWVGLKPEDGTSVDVCVETDRKNTFKEKIISSTKAKVPGEPFAVRSKIKAKKFVYYRLLLSVDEIMPAVTVTNVDFRVRQTGYAK